MKRTLLSLFASVVLAGTFVVAQSSPGSQQPGSQQPTSPGQRDPSPTPTPSSPGAQSSQQKAPDVTLTGCLVQGSSPSVFILENARTSTDPATSKGKSYIVTAVAGTDLKQHLNHQIRVVGTEASAAGSMSGPSSSLSSPGSSSPSPGSQSQPGSQGRPEPGSQSQPGSSSQAGSPSSSAQAAAQSASSQSDERDMPKFTARTVTMVASTCSAA